MADLVLDLRKVEIKDTDPKTARQIWMSLRQGAGYVSYSNLLTPPDSNTKLQKSKKDAVIYGLSLAQADSAKVNVCRYSTKECRRGCVSYAGKGELHSVIKARILRTHFLEGYPGPFISLLKEEIQRLKQLHGDNLALRLNTFSDIPWEDIDPRIFSDNKGVQFYDYTKWPERNPPKNYHLTYSASEITTLDAIKYKVAAKQNVAVLFDTIKGHALPKTWEGLRVIDGDESDARFLDPKGVIVGLRAKGRMRKGNWHMVKKVRQTTKCTRK